MIPLASTGEFVSLEGLKLVNDFLFRYSKGTSAKRKLKTSSKIAHVPLLVVCTKYQPFFGNIPYNTMDGRVVLHYIFHLTTIMRPRADYSSDGAGKAIPLHGSEPFRCLIKPYIHITLSLGM